MLLFGSINAFLYVFFAFMPMNYMTLLAAAVIWSHLAPFDIVIRFVVTAGARARPIGPGGPEPRQWG